MPTIKDYLYVLIFFLLVLFATYFISKKIKYKDDRIKRIPFLLITIAIISLELARQIIAVINGYTPDNLPLYLCSLFIPLFALATFSKPGSKLSKTCYSLSLIIGLPMALSILSLPSIVFNLQVYGSATQHIFTSDAVFRHYHSFFFHMLAVFFVTLYIAVNQYKPKKKDLLLSLSVFFVFVLISTIISKVVDVDYIRIWSFPLKLPISVLVILYQGMPLIGYGLAVLISKLTRASDNYGKKIPNDK